MTKDILFEQAIDCLVQQNEVLASQKLAETRKLEALLAQLDGIPDRQDAYDPLVWDKDGLPE